MLRVLLAVCFLFLLPLNIKAQLLPEHSVFHTYRGSAQKWRAFQDHPSALYTIISNEAYRLLDVRANQTDQITDSASWLAYQERVIKKLSSPLSRFNKTPLRANVTGFVERETFRVEKLIFESHPGFFVTAALFLPNNADFPAPAIIYTSGHSELGFRSDAYQRVIINLVNKGFIVLAFDPLGQGERLQYFDGATGKSAIGGPTTEHSYAGVQALMTGRSLSEFFIWDGIRAIDYLESRPEVDITRVGITGRSGGGTQTAMIGAVDSRVTAAAPEAYLTGFRRLFQSIGPQDAEQNPYSFLADTLDHADFLHARAPKPTLIITTEQDFFSQQGALETYREGKRSYTALGYPHHLLYTKDEGGHTSTRLNREALYRFFQEFLLLPGDATDEEVELFAPEELWATQSGQVAIDYPDSKTVFDLLQEIPPVLFPGGKEGIQMLKARAGTNFNYRLKSGVYTGKFGYHGIPVMKYFLENNKGDYALPLYIMGEPGKTSKWLVWLHPEGKQALLNHPEIERLNAAGYVIVAPDLPGTGELFDPEYSGDGTVQGVQFNYTFGAQLSGRSVSGIRADALYLVGQFLASEFSIHQNSLCFLAEGNLTTALSLYASLRKEMMRGYLVNDKDNTTLIRSRYYSPADAFGVVPGTLPRRESSGFGISMNSSEIIINSVDLLEALEHLMN